MSGSVQIHVHLHPDVSSGAADTNLWHALNALQLQVHTMSPTINEVEQKVTDLTTALASAQAATDAKQEALAAAFAELQDMVENGADTERLTAVAEQLEAALTATAALTADIDSTQVPNVAPPVSPDVPLPEDTLPPE